MQQLAELRPGVHVAVVARELLDRLVHEGDEGLRRVVVQRRADDLQLGQQSRLEEVQQPPRQELASRQVAGRTEQHHGHGLLRLHCHVIHIASQMFPGQ